MSARRPPSTAEKARSRFRDALAAPGLRGVAEVKRRSPSAGDLRPGADVAALVRAFEAAGAAACSILVDAAFGGSLEDLRIARAATRLPLLAKGFFRTEEDVAGLAEAGADAVLLILRDLDDETARRLQGRARGLGLDALVEAHDAVEVRRAAALGADPIGVNARDLGTFAIDRRGQLDLVSSAPRDRIVVAESAIEHRAQAAEAELAGADAVLVGTALMRAADPAARLAGLLARPLVKVCGLTRAEDVSAAAEAGADLAGFVLAPSPRRAEAPLPVPASMLSVAVLVGHLEEHGTDLIQLHGEENGHRSREATLLRRASPVARVLDLPWEGDDPAHWERTAAAAERERVMLAGRLGPENIGTAIRRARPWAVDASRSLETAPGMKDPARVRAFVEAARAASRPPGFADSAGTRAAEGAR